MNPSRFARNAVSFSLVVFLAACGASAVQLREDHASGDGWKRDFRMTAELSSLPKGSSYEVKVQSLDDLLLGSEWRPAVMRKSLFQPSPEA